MDTIIDCVIATERIDNEKRAQIFASVNLDFDKVQTYLPMIHRLEKSYHKNSLRSRCVKVILWIWTKLLLIQIKK